MAVANYTRRLGNKLYKIAFPIYRPLYSSFKAYADRAERRILADWLQPGAVAVDAGANIGIYSQFLSQCVGSVGTVHSFEPSPDNFRRLREGLEGFPNVRLNQLAVSDKTGESILYVSDELNVDHRAYATAGETRATIPIQTISLDDYFKPGERVDLIKMDIQGYELHGLLGAGRVLADNPQMQLLLEFWPYGLKQAGMSGEALIAFLVEHGFTLFFPSENGLLQWDDPPAYFSGNKDYLNLFGHRKIQR